MYTHTHILPHILYSSVDEHLDDFHILSIVNNAAMNIEVFVSFQISVFVFVLFFFDKYPGVEFLGHMVVEQTLLEGNALIF